MLARAERGVARERCAGLDGDSPLVVERMAPARLDAGTRHPGAGRLLVQGDGQYESEDRHLHRLELRRVVHVVVVPEPEIEFDAQALPGTDPLEKAFHVPPHHRGKLPLAADLPEHRSRVVVAAQRVESRGVVEHEAVFQRMLRDELGQDQRGRLVLPQPHQRLRHQEADGGGVRAVGFGERQYFAQ